MDKEHGYDEEFCAETLKRAGWKLRDVGSYPKDEVDHTPQDSKDHTEAKGGKD